MNLIQLTYKYRPVIGGQEVYVSQLQKIFRASGWNAKVIQPAQGVRADDIYPTFRVRGPGRLIRGLDEYQFMWMTRLLQGKRLREADVIIAHYAIHARYLDKYHHKTLVLSHGVEWYPESNAWFDRLREKNAKACLGRFPHVVNDTHYLRHAGIDVQPGQGYFQEIVPGIWFIPNCVDLHVFRPVQSDRRVSQYHPILVPRQIVPDRGVPLAIEAFALVSRKEPNCYLYVIGKSSDSGYMKYCLQVAQQAGVTQRVIFAPPKPNEEMPPVYCAAQLTLIPTLRREGTSLSALESMACGTPTVVTSVAGLRDLPAVQAEPNPQALATAILETVRARDRIGREQQRRVQEGFNLDRWQKAWCAVVRRVAQSP